MRRRRLLQHHFVDTSYDEAASVSALEVHTMEALAQIVPFAVLGAAMYFVVLRPQMRRNQAHRELMNSLVEGDEVLTGSGLYGLVAQIDEDIIWLDVADGVELKLAKSSVTSRIDVTGERD